MGVVREALVEGDVATYQKWLKPTRFTDIIGNPWYQLLIKLQHTVTTATFAFWSKHNVRTLHLPITTNAVSSPMGRGSDSLPVEIDLFNQRTFLADSMQFSLEYGCRFHEQGCFYLMPSFRGEDADETHLCQFYHSEVEVPGTLYPTIDLASDYLRFIAAAVLLECADDLRAHAKGTAHIENILNLQSVPVIDFDEADNRLKHVPGAITRHKGWRDLSRAGERELIRAFRGPVWVTEWDHLAVPFYQAFADGGQEKALCADLLLGFGEVIGLGQRHRSLDEAAAALTLHQVEPGPYAWYLEMKRHSPRQTSGFGMGVERFLLWILDHDDIRDLQILPRFNGRASCP